MRLIDDRSGLEVLTRDECQRLLGTGGVGRVAVIDGGHPMIFPVNYVVDGEDVVFRTAEGTKFDAAARGQVIAFEIDEADPIHHVGWSVVVAGRAEEVLDPARRARLAAGRLRPWADGQKDRFVAVRPERVTGRRIGHADPPGDRPGG